jgi:hypothetical protein
MSQQLQPEKMPPCLWCKTNKHVYAEGYAGFFCRHCKRSFDKGGLNEGGDYSNRNPAVRLEREERRLEGQPRKRRGFHGR